MAEPKNVAYLVKENMRATIKALREAYNHAQAQMDLHHDLGDEWVKWQGERAQALNALQIFEALGPDRWGAWTITFEPGDKGIEQAHMKMTGRNLHDGRMADYDDRDPGEFDYLRDR